MATIGYRDKRFALIDGESVLDVLLRNGVEIQYACRTGVCRTCTLVASQGTPTEFSQRGLREQERRQGMFLACQCRPSEDLDVRELDAAASIPARIVELDRLTDSVVRVRLETDAAFDYEPGQYVALRRDDGITRSFSLASLSTEPWLELHIRRVPDGRMSRWIYDDARPGDVLAIRGPFGSCCYPSDEPDAPLLMVAVGTGLAPLWGVIRRALAAGHRGPITLLQAAADPSGLYLSAELDALTREHPQLRVRRCVLRGGDATHEQGAVDELAVQHLRGSSDPAAHLAFVCGDAMIVQRVRRGLFMAGLSARRILADAFVQAPASVS